MIKRKITVLPTWILQPIYKIHTIFAERFKFLNIHTNFLGYNRDVFHYHKKLPTQLNLSAQDLKKGENYLKEKFGLNKNDKFVCITVRDNEYLKKEFPNIDFSYHDFRQTKLEKFIPAIKAIQKKGFYVFRMGKYTEKKLKLKNKKIIDYANSPYRNDFLDIYLTSQCSFHLATNTGLQQVSEVFKIPTATLIVPVGHMPLFKENYLFN